MSSENFDITKINVGAKPFTRPRDDRVIFGVCSGLARKLGISSTLSRIIFSVLTLLTGGSLAIAYLIIFLVSSQE